jgi:hypothetical protein
MSEEEKGLVVWTDSDITRFREKADFLLTHEGELEKYIAQDFMEQTVLLGETAKLMIAKAGSQEKAADIARLALVGHKLHEGWREMALPVIKRLLQGGKKKDGRGATQQVPAARGSAVESGRTGRGRKERPEPDPDAEEGGVPGVVEGELLGVSHGEGSGYGASDHPDS